jgi:CheY-like chemotaxis protein
MDDEFSYCDEENSATNEISDPWNILIVDDDIDVHGSTRLTLMNVRINGRELRLIHHYSGHEAIAYLKNTLDVDLILLDMIMETYEAGLEVARWLREDAGRLDTPIIILRTGQPAQFRTEDILMNKHFNGMVEKSSMTRQKLITLLTDLLPGASSHPFINPT